MEFSFDIECSIFVHCFLCCGDFHAKSPTVPELNRSDGKSLVVDVPKAYFMLKFDPTGYLSNMLSILRN